VNLFKLPPRVVTDQRTTIWYNR